MSSHTRRDLFRTTGLGVLAAGVGEWLGCQAPAPAPKSVIGGAAEVEFLAPPMQPPDYSRDLERYLIRVANELGAKRKQALDAIQGRDAFVEHQKSVQQQFWKMLGGSFDKTPLNPQITGTLARDGYRIEKVIYESRPQLYVTANLYVPEGRSGRLPAILGPLGHANNGKAWSSYQRLFANLARKGYVVLAYDPFGQGERIEYPGAHPGQSKLSGEGEHELAGERLILLGVNFGLYRAWDGIRGIDYLLSRPEVDPERIGCTGQSGGGAMTQILVALDDRIRAAVVSEGNTENIAEANLEPPGSADDPEQNIVPSLAQGLDRADLLHIFAPRPLLITITTHDIGNTYSPEYVSGTVEQLEELKRSYNLLGAPDQVALVATTQQHGYTYEQRRAAYGWFNRWLDNKQADDHEAGAPVEPDEALLCTKTGFVVTSLGGETALSLTRKRAAGISAPPAAASREALLTSVRQVLALPDDSAEMSSRLLCRIQKAGYVAEQFESVSEAEIRTPGWLLSPDAGAESVATILYLGDRATSRAVAEDGPADRLCAGGGFRVCAVDLRGRGDCSPAYPARGPHYFSYRMNEQYLNWFTLILGKPLLGGQVFDALRALDYLRSRKEISQERIWVMGDGPHGLIALYVAALDDQVHGAIVRGSVTDYRSLATAEECDQPFGIYLHDVLRNFDLPDLAAAVAPRPLLLLDSTSPDGKPAQTEQTTSIYGRASQAYAAAGNAEQFAIRASSEKTPAFDLVQQWIVSGSV